ncbi:MAG: 30S ribosomal protein S1 [Nitrospira bacterium HGW-Nitrospira-1]|nr:MAG: 30S ribosomal protein S1 [Nitrospira bacterium HGW-Nitrospira-1]
MEYEDIKDNSVEQGESFAKLLEKNGTNSARLAPGQKVKARVVSISGDFVYIDIGGKSEGIIDLEEFREKDGSVRIKEGEDVEAFFLSVQNGVRKLTTLVNGYSAVELKSLQGAYEAGLPVNGEVRREVKGGFEVQVGGVRCFCPYSQIDMKGGREGGVYLGQTFPFKVLEYEEEGRNIILSRRVLLVEEKQAVIDRLKETLKEGAEITGSVSSLQKFGAFVDIGGMEGLVPISEISWTRIEKLEDALALGQEVTAKIISIDWDNHRLTLSLKALQPDPWSLAAEKYPIDGRVNGTIVRLAPFGAFVNLEPGIDGLVHISNLGAGRRINHPREVVEVGQMVEVYVLAVDPENRRLSLSMQPKVEPKKIVLPEVGELIDGVVNRVMPYGIFLRMGNGLNGLIPNSEMGTPAGSDHKRMFPSGAEMQVVVVDVDAGSNKVRLSRKAVIENAAKEEYDEYRTSVKQAEGQSGGLGSLGDIFKAKLKEKNLNS